MAKRRAKKRTHVGASNATNPQKPQGASARNPKSMVIRIGAGEVGASVSQLVADVRKVMEPGTASRLKERRANKLKDYVVMAGPLGVTHLMLFSRSESGNTNLRLALAPRGPTFHFRIEQYSLCKDVQKSQRHPRGGGKEYISPPLLVMNNFTSQDSTATSKVPRHLENLTTTAFQSLFPPINPQETPLKSIKRVLLLNREQNEEEDGSFILNYRHYAITTRATGVSRQLRRIHNAEKLVAPKTSRKGQVPNLGQLEDIADFMIGGADGEGYMTDATSASEADTDNEVEVLEPSRKKVHSSRNDTENGKAEAEVEESVERRAVKLVELGPRLRLRMTKVEDGLCSGRILWHEYISKTRAEEKELDQRWDKRQKEKESRRKVQRANVEKKRQEKEQKTKIGQAVEDEDEMDEDEWYSDDDNQEVEAQEVQELLDEKMDGAE